MKAGKVPVLNAGNGVYSITPQLFINSVDNPFLDHREKTSQGWGYCVFGNVMEGMKEVGAIESLPTTVEEVVFRDRVE